MKSINEPNRVVQRTPSRAPLTFNVGHKTMIKKTVLIFCSLVLTGCVFESDRELILRQADDYEQRGFTMTAADRRKEAASASDQQHLKFIGPDDSSSTCPQKPEIILKGNERDGYPSFPKTPITVESAIERAKPFLDKCTLRRAEMLNVEDRMEMIVHVYFIEGKYYVVKDTYPAKLSRTLYAVIVNPITGKVTPPK